MSHSFISPIPQDARVAFPLSPTHHLYALSRELELLGYVMAQASQQWEASCEAGATPPLGALRLLMQAHDRRVKLLNLHGPLPCAASVAQTAQPRPASPAAQSHSVHSPHPVPPAPEAPPTATPAAQFHPVHSQHPVPPAPVVPPPRHPSERMQPSAHKPSPPFPSQGYPHSAPQAQPLSTCQLHNFRMSTRHRAALPRGQMK